MIKLTIKCQLVFPSKENQIIIDVTSMILETYNLSKNILHEFKKASISLCVMADINLEYIMFRVIHKESKMTHQVYSYFYPEHEERSADQFTKFIEEEKYLF